MEKDVSRFGRYYEEFEEGDRYEHEIRKTVTESDNNLFCLLTLNHHPIHSDYEYAAESDHGRVLVVGTYVISLVVGLTVPDTSGKAIANLEYSSARHLAPVHVGDTLKAETTVLSKRLSRKREDRGIVTLETRAFNQNGTEVLELQRKILVPTTGSKR